MDTYETVCVDCQREHCRRKSEPEVRSRRRFRPAYDRRRVCSSTLFIAGSFVIGLIMMPCAMSAPVPLTSQSQSQLHLSTASATTDDAATQPTGTPFWFNPCGMQMMMEDTTATPCPPGVNCNGGGGSGAMAGSGGGSGHEMMDSEPRRLVDVIEGVTVSASNALMHAEQFAGSFVSDTFHVDVKQHHDVWKDTALMWLQQAEYMPKELDEPLDESYLSSLTIKDVLHAVNVGLQHLAVGLEQVSWDQDRDRQPFSKDFKEATFKLRAVLCEISVALIEINETVPAPVSRDIMPVESRISTDNRSLRDWLILREYITSLQYIIQVFEFLKSKK
ncbi:uncharacterized protein LOC126833870 [Adelges cooleyi]|uniref:uncharacterized protein LOC126833870 n=1 Tax=Adelges cooleyi TaxID=133065 RepID=UPI0021806635|nr:uncharacterized protein LOC126833870 [Adelges cooleyi]